MLITYEFMMNAIKFDTTYWFIPTSLVALYLFVDFVRAFITKVYLISTLTWQGWESLVFSALLITSQYFIYTVFSNISNTKTLNGATRSFD